MIEEINTKLIAILLELKDVKVTNLEKLLEAKALIVRAVTKLSKLEEI